MSPRPEVIQCIAAKPADRSSSAIAKSNSSLHSDVTEALALPNKTQRADSRQRARAPSGYTTAGWESFFATCDIVSSRESQLRQVTSGRLIATRLLQFKDVVCPDAARVRYFVKRHVRVCHVGTPLAFPSFSGSRNPVYGFISP
jgi:hypothetical protein